MIDNIFFDSKILPIIRLGLNLDVDSDHNISLSDSELEDLLCFSTKQSILPITIKGLHRLNRQYQIKNEYLKKHAKCVHQYVLQETAIKTLCKILDKHYIPYILLKGAVIRDLYPEKELRTCCDIDILVHHEDLNKAIEYIEKESDFKTRETGYHDISMVNKYVHLELHFSVKVNSEKLDACLEKAWDHTINANEGCKYGFSSEFQVFYIISHMCHHFLVEGLGVRPFIDLWYLLNKTIFNENEVFELCDACGISKFYKECVHLSEVWFDSKDQTNITIMLEKALLNGGVYGSRDFGYAVRQGNSHGIKYIFKRIFPPAYQVREFYKDKTGKRYSLIYLYYLRLKSWFQTDRRRELKKQLDGIISVDKEQLKFADELLNELGL